MLNSNSKDGTKVPTSTNADVPTSSQTIANPNVRRSISWSEKEISMLMNYEESNDSETLDERLDSARYMLHYESGHDFPSRSLSSVKKKFYEERKRRHNAI